jgi:hypothetical protein
MLNINLIGSCLQLWSFHFFGLLFSSTRNCPDTKFDNDKYIDYALGMDLDPLGSHSLLSAYKETLAAKEQEILFLKKALQNVNHYDGNYNRSTDEQSENGIVTSSTLILDDYITVDHLH